MRDTFIKYLQTVERDGIDELIKKLDEWEFFTTPASSNHHCNHTGGLVEHSLNVLRYALDLADVMGLPCTDSVVLCSLGHDIGKSNGYYVPNYLSSGHQSEKKPFKINPELRNKDHALRGIIMLTPIIKLLPDELDAILFHMGFYERSSADYWKNPSPLAMCVHYADMMATKYENGEL